MAKNKNPILTLQPEDENKPFLSPELLDHIASFVDINTLSAFSRTCKFTLSLFASLLKLTEHRLLKYVMDGNPNAVKRLLRTERRYRPNNCLITTKICGNESNGNHWKAVSPIQFAAWAGDDDMLAKILSYARGDELPEILVQLQEVKNVGIQYGKSLTPYRTLIAAYDVYLEGTEDRESSWDDKKRITYACKTIAPLQFKLPLVGLQWFCDKMPFFRDMDFNRSPERSCFISYRTKALNTSSLSIHFPIFKSMYRCDSFDDLTLHSKAVVLGHFHIYLDNKAIKQLVETSDNHLSHVIVQLEEKIVRNRVSDTEITASP